MHAEAHTSKNLQSSFKKWLHHPVSGPVRLVITLFAFTDVAYGLFVYKTYVAQFTSTWKDFLVSTGDELAIWTGRLFWLFIVIFFVLVPIVRGKAPRLIEPFELAQPILDWIRKALNKRGHVITALAVLFIGFVGLLMLWYGAPSLASPASGQLVAPTLPGDLRLFIIRQDSIVILNRTSFTPIHQFPPIKSLENIAVTKDLKHIFATDWGGTLHEFSTETQQETNSISVRPSASGLALSADGRKLYVAVQGPIPEGKIFVFDVERLKLNPKPIASIGGVGCPISLFAASRAPRLFVATQCGAGLDPVYVIDTRSDLIIAKVPGFAVGTRIVATPDGKKAIVSTGDSVRILEDYTSVSPKTTIARMPVGSIAVSPDGKLLMVGTPPGLKTFDILRNSELKDEDKCAEVGLETVPSAIAVTTDMAVYAQLATRFFVTDIGALSCKTRP